MKFLIFLAFLSQLTACKKKTPKEPLAQPLQREEQSLKLIEHNELIEIIFESLKSKNPIILADAIAGQEGASHDERRYRQIATDVYENWEKWNTLVDYGHKKGLIKDKAFEVIVDALSKLSSVSGDTWTSSVTEAAANRAKAAAWLFGYGQGNTVRGSIHNSMQNVHQQLRYPFLEKNFIERLIRNALREELSSPKLANSAEIETTLKYFDLYFPETNGKIDLIKEMLKSSLKSGSKSISVFDAFMRPSAEGQGFIIDDNKLRARMFFGIIDQVGPSMQKLLQSGVANFPPDMQKELKDVQDNLRSMDEKIVTEQMQKLAEANNWRFVDPPEAESGVLKSYKFNVGDVLFDGDWVDIAEQRFPRLRVGSATMGDAYMVWVERSPGTPPEKMILKFRKQGIEDRLATEQQVYKRIADDLDIRGERGKAQDIKKTTGLFVKTVVDEMDFSQEPDLFKHAKDNRWYRGDYEISVETGKGILSSLSFDVIEEPDGIVFPDDMKQKTVAMTAASGLPLKNHMAKAVDDVKAASEALNAEGLSAEESERFKGQLNEALERLEKIKLIGEQAKKNWLASAFDPEQGFFHGDSHSGNIFLDLESTPPKITYIDFGGSGVLRPDQTSSIIKLFALGEAPETVRNVLSINERALILAESLEELCVTACDLKVYTNDFARILSSSQANKSKAILDFVAGKSVKFHSEVDSFFRAYGIVETSLDNMYRDKAEALKLVETNVKPSYRYRPPNTVFDQKYNYAYIDGSIKDDKTRYNASLFEEDTIRRPVNNAMADIIEQMHQERPRTHNSAEIVRALRNDSLPLHMRGLSMDPNLARAGAVAGPSDVIAQALVRGLKLTNSEHSCLWRQNKYIQICHSYNATAEIAPLKNLCHTQGGQWHNDKHCGEGILNNWRVCNSNKGITIYSLGLKDPDLFCHTSKKNWQ